MGFRDGVMQPARRLGDGDDEDEVEEELERRRGAVCSCGDRAAIRAMSRAPGMGPASRTDSEEDMSVREILSRVPCAWPCAQAGSEPRAAVAVS